MTSHGSPSLSSTARHPMHVLFFLVNLAIIPNPPEEVTTVLERVWLPSGNRGRGKEDGCREAEMRGEQRRERTITINENSPNITHRVMLASLILLTYRHRLSVSRPSNTWVVKLTEKLGLGSAVSQDGFKNPQQWLGELVLQIVRRVNRDVVLQDIDRVLHGVVGGDEGV